jgi:hypothetical protein
MVFSTPIRRASRGASGENSPRQTTGQGRQQARAKRRELELGLDFGQQGRGAGE